MFLQKSDIIITSTLFCGSAAGNADNVANMVSSVALSFNLELQAGDSSRNRENMPKDPFSLGKTQHSVGQWHFSRLTEIPLRDEEPDVGILSGKASDRTLQSEPFQCPSTCTDDNFCKCTEAYDDAVANGLDCTATIASSCRSGEIFNCIDASLLNMYKHYYCPIFECLESGKSEEVCYCDAYRSICGFCQDTTADLTNCVMDDANIWNGTEICFYASKCEDDTIPTLPTGSDFNTTKCPFGICASGGGRHGPSHSGRSIVLLELTAAVIFGYLFV